MKSFVEHVGATAFLYDPEGNPVYAPTWRDRAYKVTERDRRRITGTKVGIWFCVFLLIPLMDASPLPFLAKFALIVPFAFLVWPLAEFALSSRMVPAEVAPEVLRDANIAGNRSSSGDLPFFGTMAIITIAFCAGEGIQALFRPEEFSRLEVGICVVMVAGSLLGDHLVRRHRPG